MATSNRMGCFSWAGVVLVGLIALRVCTKSTSPSQQTDTTEAIATAAKPPEKLPPLAAAKLLQAYKANEVKADLAYKGKRFHVTGTVVGIRSDFADDPQVELVTGLLGVMASGLRKEFAATLSKGDVLEADCTVAGSVMGSPMLDCSAQR